MPQLSTLSERLDAAFKQAGVSVAQVATACGISVQAVYKWLRGDSADLEGAHLVKVAELTGTSCAWLETGKGPRVVVYARNDRQASVLKAMEKLDEPQSAAIEQIACAMAGNKASDQSTL